MESNYQISIYGKFVNLEFSVHALLAYEAMTKRPFNPQALEHFLQPKSLDEFCKLFYCCVITSEPDLELTYDEFVDWLDFSPYQLLSGFRDFVDEAIDAETGFIVRFEEEANEE